MVIDMFADSYELRSCGGTSSNLPRAVPGSQAFLADRFTRSSDFIQMSSFLAGQGLKSILMTGRPARVASGRNSVAVKHYRRFLLSTLQHEEVIHTNLQHPRPCRENYITADLSGSGEAL
ncbi:MAG: hypothetical protein KatS3mg081_2092 [Gemmatimonadales bacterium]|nr:MAG: hypothetical protein KatS3mg081_2092 [Gemmatimonadales bacterium]